MSKISQKMYSALTRGGISPDVARRFAENVEFLGESTDETNDRDNYDILLTAKALSSLVKRHRDITPIMPKLDDVAVSADMTRVNSPVRTTEPAEVSAAPDTKLRKASGEPSIIKSIKKTSPGMQRFLTYLMPCVWFLLLGLLFIGCIAASIASICAVITVTVGGIILFFAGLLYGVSQFSVFTGAAFFEIGLSLILGGLAVGVSVLIYNFLTRTLPFCLKNGSRGLLKLNSAFTVFRNSLKNSAEN